MYTHVLTLGVTTGPNSARMTSAKSVPADFGPFLVSFCRKIFFPSPVPHTGTNGIIGKLNHSLF